MIALLVAVFIVSGAAGLIYESIWSRYLGLFVGHSAYAQIIVLVIFLGGMSLGAHLAGKRSSRLRSPLLWYAGIELVVGILALAFHDVFEASTALAYESVFPALAGAPLQIVKWAIAGALIFPQSVLLGATFPLMSAGAIRLAHEETTPGRLLGTLYFANSIGAAVGVLLAGFYFIETTGIPGTLLVAGIMNVLAAMAVVLIARAHARREASAALAGEPMPAASETGAPMAELDPRLARTLLLVAFGTAVASFVYEIAWIRMLSLVLGSATHSFELMLSAFILGLALGALWIRNRADRLGDPIRFLGVVQWIMGLLAVATLPLYLASFEWIATLIQTVQTNENGYRVFLVGRYVVSLIVMLPATFCAGMTLPLITRVLMRGGAGERAIGTVYAVNTLGSIAGVVLAGLLLMPLLGLKRLLVFGAVIDIALGVWLLLLGSRLLAARGEAALASRRVSLRPSFDSGSSLAIPVIVTIVLLVGVAVAARFDLARITSGVYRHGVVTDPGEYTFPFYKDGRTATVSMRRSADGFVTLATNGKPDASLEKAWMDSSIVPPNDELLRLTRDIATQLLLPIISLAHAPRAEQLAVIGQGSGMSSHMLLGSPHAREVVTIEIEPEMISASRLFRPANRRVFEDPRSTFVIDDARSYFAASRRSFDLILSEPSNPWVSGVSGLFTVEFYDRVRRQLAPGGVFGQWLHLYELSDGLVTSVLAAIDSIFPAYEVFFTSNSDILVVAANDSLREPDWSVVGYPGIAADLRRVVPLTPELFDALRLGNRDVLHPLLMTVGAPNSDYFPVLDLGAERMRFMRESATGFIGLSEGRFNVVAALAGRRVGFGTMAISATPEIDRTVDLAVGTRVRAVQSMLPHELVNVPRDENLRIAMYRVDQLDRLMAVPRAPMDWHAWIRAVLSVDEHVHGGTAGVVDSALFARLRAFAARHGAPAEARAALDFLHGIGAWNWAEVAVSARLLMASQDSVDWLPDPLLRNGAAIAFIKLNDAEGAQEVLRHFARRTTEDRFRERLISSYLIASDSTLRSRMGWK